MLGSKITQSFNMNPGEQLSSRKADKNNYVSAEQKAKMGDESVGDVLNRVADPNWVDPSKLRKVGKEKLDKDDFLKLMLTQMKFQDPTTPLESHEMAAQLAQFTSLEQMQNMNTNIEKLVAAKKPDTQFQALQFIGKSVESDSGKILRAEGDDTHEIRFNVAKAAKDLTVDIKNEDGDVIKSYKLQQLEQGQNSITWNGLNAEDKPARAGNYKVEVSAVDEQDQKIVTSTKISGTITGVNYTANGPMLMIGNQSVPMSEVRKIVDPKAGPVKGTDVKDVTKLALNNDDKVKDTENKPKASEQIINDVPMARGLLNKVKSGKE